jgi:CDP-diacylglycerol--serine O-phosphatidyltransferase
MIADLPWHQMLRYIMLGLSFLMISNVQYAAMPTIGYRSVRQILGSLLVIGTIFGVIFLPKQFFFPAAMAYVLYGLVATVFIGLLDRLPGREDAHEDSRDDTLARAHDLPDEEDDADDLPPAAVSRAGTEDGAGSEVRRRRRRRRPRGSRPGSQTDSPPPSNPTEE